MRPMGGRESHREDDDHDLGSDYAKSGDPLALDPRLTLPEFAGRQRRRPITSPASSIKAPIVRWKHRTLEEELALYLIHHPPKPQPLPQEFFFTLNAVDLPKEVPTRADRERIEQPQEVIRPDSWGCGCWGYLKSDGKTFTFIQRCDGKKCRVE